MFFFSIQLYSGSSRGDLAAACLWLPRAAAAADRRHLALAAESGLVNRSMPWIIPARNKWIQVAPLIPGLLSFLPWTIPVVPKKKTFGWTGTNQPACLAAYYGLVLPAQSVRNQLYAMQAPHHMHMPWCPCCLRCICMHLTNNQSPCFHPSCVVVNTIVKKKNGELFKLKLQRILSENCTTVVGSSSKPIIN